MKKDTRNYGKFHPRFAEGGEVNDPYGLLKAPVHEGEHDPTSPASLYETGSELVRESYRGGGDWPEFKRGFDKKMIVSPSEYETKRESVYRRGGPVRKKV